MELGVIHILVTPNLKTLEKQSQNFHIDDRGHHKPTVRVAFAAATVFPENPVPHMLSVIRKLLFLPFERPY